MISKNIPWLIVLVLIIISTILYFRGNPKQADITNYKHKIDSLQNNINLLEKNNFLIYDSIRTLGKRIQFYDLQVIDLQKQLKNEKIKTQELVNSVDAWSNNDIILFFEQYYK